jgi:hypothetical protein
VVADVEYLAVSSRGGGDISAIGDLGEGKRAEKRSKKKE